MSSFGDAHRFLCMHRVRELRFGRLSRANERADRGRTHQPALNTSAVQAAASAHRCGHALAFCALSAPRPVWRARANTKTRDYYRTFESAHRAQTTCAPAHRLARQQAPQSVAQWLLPFSPIVPPAAAPPALLPNSRTQIRERVLFIERHRRGHLQFQARGSR